MAEEKKQQGLRSSIGDQVRNAIQSYKEANDKLYTATEALNSFDKKELLSAQEKSSSSTLKKRSVIFGITGGVALVGAIVLGVLGGLAILASAFLPPVAIAFGALALLSFIAFVVFRVFANTANAKEEAAEAKRRQLTTEVTTAQVEVNNTKKQLSPFFNQSSVENLFFDSCFESKVQYIGLEKEYLCFTLMKFLNSDQTIEIVDTAKKVLQDQSNFTKTELAKMLPGLISTSTKMDSRMGEAFRQAGVALIDEYITQEPIDVNANKDLLKNALSSVLTELNNNDLSNPQKETLTALFNHYVTLIKDIRFQTPLQELLEAFPSNTHQNLQTQRNILQDKHAQFAAINAVLATNFNVQTGITTTIRDGLCLVATRDEKLIQNTMALHPTRKTALLEATLTASLLKLSSLNLTKENETERRALSLFLTSNVSAADVPVLSALLAKAKTLPVRNINEMLILIGNTLETKQQVLNEERARRNAEEKVTQKRERQSRIIKAQNQQILNQKNGSTKALMQFHKAVMTPLLTEENQHLAYLGNIKTPNDSALLKDERFSSIVTQMGDRINTQKDQYNDDEGAFKNFLGQFESNIDFSLQLLASSPNLPENTNKKQLFALMQVLIALETFKDPRTKQISDENLRELHNKLAEFHYVTALPAEEKVSLTGSMQDDYFSSETPTGSDSNSSSNGSNSSPSVSRSSSASSLASASASFSSSPSTSSLNGSESDAKSTPPSSPPNSKSSSFSTPSESSTKRLEVTKEQKQTPDASSRERLGQYMSYITKHYLGNEPLSHHIKDTIKTEDLASIHIDQKNTNDRSKITTSAMIPTRAAIKNSQLASDTRPSKFLNLWENMVSNNPSVPSSNDKAPEAIAARDAIAVIDALRPYKKIPDEEKNATFRSFCDTGYSTLVTHLANEIGKRKVVLTKGWLSDDPHETRVRKVAAALAMLIGIEMFTKENGGISNAHYAQLIQLPGQDFNNNKSSYRGSEGCGGYELLVKGLKETGQKIFPLQALERSPPAFSTATTTNYSVYQRSADKKHSLGPSDTKLPPPRRGPN